MQFFKLNDNIQIAIEVIGEPIPFENRKLGDPIGLYWDICDTSGVQDKIDANRLGAVGTIHLLVDRPFVGSLEIPRRKIAEVGVSWAEPALGPLPVTREVFFGAKIDIPQSCKLTPGQNMVIDFGTRNREMFARPGQPPILPVERNYTLQCKTTGPSVKVDLVLEAEPHVREKRYIKTSNSGVGIAVESSGKLIAPKPSGVASAAPDQRLPIDVDYASKRAAFGITAFPVRTVNLPATGAYKGEATIKFEFQ
ncbi:fimbrial protein [Burkholderia sp. AW49-1]